MKYIFPFLMIFLVSCFNQDAAAMNLKPHGSSNGEFSFLILDNEATLTRDHFSYSFKVVKERADKLVLKPIDNTFSKELFLIYIDEVKLWRCPQCIYLGYPNFWKEGD